MFKRFLLLVVTIPTLFGFTSSIIACQWDLNPDVLLITSYENAHEQTTEDQIIYQKLRSIYGNQAITAIFSHQDDNVYANILQNLITKFNLKKVFILDPSFNDYLPKTSSQELPNTSLIRVLQQFTNIDFYFFNNQIANTIKVTNNIYEFRFNNPSKDQANPPTYGELLAQHFKTQLVVEGTEDIDTTKYNFDIDSQARWIIRIGVINNIGNSYQQKVIEQFIAALENNIPNNTVYQYHAIKLDITNSYNSDNVKIVEETANVLYQNNLVNFIFNSNYWYNNAIAHAAINTSSLGGYTKTIKFITNSVMDKDTYKYQDKNYMMFSYNLDFAILDYTIDNSFPQGNEVPAGALENFHAYGLNNNLNFVDGL